MKMQHFVYALFAAALAALSATPSRAQGTTPLALVQQFDKSGNGQVLTGCFIYFYVAGTVATLTQVYQDFGLTLTAPNPLQCDTGGRVPMHWVASGPVHVRLTDATGVVQLDTTLQSIGPGGGGGGGGGGPAIDPNAVAQIGDIKARFDTADLRAFGWVQMNGTTIGPPASGATQFASNQAQNLFIYLWQNCSDAHCPINGATGNRGPTAQADWSNGSKAIAVPDMRSKTFVGRDCMGTGCAGLLLASNITSGGSDGVDTVGAGGGLANQTAQTYIAQTNLPSVNFAVSVSVSIPPQWSHSHDSQLNTFSYLTSGGRAAPLYGELGTATTSVTNPTLSGSGTGTAASGGNGAAATSLPFSNLQPFQLVTYYMKL